MNKYFQILYSVLETKTRELPSQQQKSAKMDSERYLMFGTNHFLVTLKWDKERLSLVLIEIQIITGSVKTKKSCASRNMFRVKFRFSKLAKRIVIRCLRANKTVGGLEYSMRFA